MQDRWLAELKLVETAYGAVETGAEHAWFVIPRWALVSGWNKQETFLLILKPPGYPITPPDNFYVDPGLRLAGDGMPGNTNPETQAGRSCLRFSYHLEQGDWSPNAQIDKGHNLLTFLQGVKKRLQELS